jgi:hypothetical protein
LFLLTGIVEGLGELGSAQKKTRDGLGTPRFGSKSNVSFCARNPSRCLSVRELSVEVGDGHDEVAVLNRHRDINGIEIPFAGKTASQIRLGIHGRSILLATWTQES